MSYDKEREAHEGNPVRITIETKVPSKWRFVDMETGDIYLWDEKTGKFKFTRDLANMVGCWLRGEMV